MEMWASQRANKQRRCSPAVKLRLKAQLGMKMTFESGHDIGKQMNETKTVIESILDGKQQAKGRSNEHWAGHC